MLYWYFYVILTFIFDVKKAIFFYENETILKRQISYWAMLRWQLGDNNLVQDMQPFYLPVPPTSAAISANPWWL